jgi:hypothetical protein
MRKHQVAGAAMLLFGGLGGCGEAGLEPVLATPAGYWEGTASMSETPMKDGNRTLTRSVEAEFWFAVTWDPVSKTGTVAGEAEAKYDAELRVENLPKVTVPGPHGASVKFEPSVGGKLEGDNRRKFPVVGVLVLDESGSGTLSLAKAQSPEHARAGVPSPWDAPMEFILRADPGVSGGISGRAGSVNYDTRTGALSGDTNFGGLENAGEEDAGAQGSVSHGVDTGRGGDLITQQIPMAPFSPFRQAGGKVEKRLGGPFTAAYTESADRLSVKWTAKQMGGEQREPPRITPEMQQQIDEMRRLLRR